MDKAKSRLKLFVENIFSYGFISVLGKLIPLIMLPIVTALLTNTADYGRYDMFLTIVEFGSSLALLGIYDAMFREFFEKENDDYKKKVTFNALAIVSCSSLIISIVLLLFNRYFSILFFGDTNHGLVVMLASLGVFLIAIRTIIAAPTRMQNKRMVFMISNVIGVIIYYLISILFVWLGYSYFGLIAAYIIYVSMLLVFFLILNFAYFKKTQLDKKIIALLLKIGVPLMPTFIAYWVFHSLDKIIITQYLGLAQVGIYSVGLRVASVSQVIYLAFAGGWQYFAFSTMHDQDQVSLNSRVFEYLCAISVGLHVVLLPFYEMVFNLLFEGDYVLGYVVAPYLFLSPLLLMLFQIASNQFLVIKKSYFVPLCLAVGLIANVSLNLTLTPLIGIEGSAIATLSGYIFALISVMILTKFKGIMKYSWRVIIVMASVFVFNSAYRLLISGAPLYVRILLVSSVGIGLIILYRVDLKKLLLMFKKERIVVSK